MTTRYPKVLASLSHNLSVTTPFRQISYRDRTLSLSVKERLSSDDLILCIHGLGCTKESFDELFSASALNDFSICTVDLPGHGASDKPDDFTYNMETYAEVVKSLIDQVSPGRLFIVAHSMGGAVAALLADLGIRPERFVNVEGNLVGEDCGIASRRIATQSLPQFLSQGYLEFIRTLESSEGVDLRTWAGWLRQASPKALHESAQSLVRWSDSERLLDAFHRFDQTTYVYGDKDTKDFLLPRLKVTVIAAVSHAGHFCMLDNPAQFCSTVADALTRT